MERERAERGGRDGMALGEALELAVKWALPASPLFLAILMLLAHAPYAAPIVPAAHFYLACTCGAVVGLAICLLPIRTTAVVAVGMCVLGGVALETAWLVLLMAERTGSAALLLCGAAAGGLSSAWLLVLWLWVGQSPSVTCEMLKFACVFGVAYVLYTLFSVVPHAGAVSYFFPVLTCVPLSVLARGQVLAGKGVEPCARLVPVSRPRVGRVLVTAALLAAFGAGFAALGFGGERVEQGAGLLALLLVGCLLTRPGDAELLRIAAMPLVVLALCYEALAGHGNAFAFFLAGCGSLVTWLFLQHRFGRGEPVLTTVRAIALRIAFIATCAGVGIFVGYAVFESLDVEPVAQLFTLVAVIVLVDFVWRAVSLPRVVSAGEGMGLVEPPCVAGEVAWACVGAEPANLPGERELYASLGLSPREVQVAELLCESRSVSYISQVLGMAPSTTKTHVRHIYEKAGVHSRSDLQLLARGR